MQPVTATHTIQYPHLATSSEIALIYGLNQMMVTRWVRRGCPILRRDPYIFDLRQVEAWRASQT